MDSITQECRFRQAVIRYSYKYGRRVHNDVRHNFYQQGIHIPKYNFIGILMKFWILKSKIIPKNNFGNYPLHISFDDRTQTTSIMSTYTIIGY